MGNEDKGERMTLCGRFEKVRKPKCRPEAGRKKKIVP